MARALFVLLVGSTIVSSAVALRESASGLSKISDAGIIGWYEERFAPLKSLLPQDQAVGYLSDRAIEDVTVDPTGLGLWYLTQYTLAPVIVASTTEPVWVVGNFEIPSRIGPLAAVHDLAVVRDFGNGVVLLRHR